MKTAMKKLLDAASILLVLAMLAAFLPVNTQAASLPTSDATLTFTSGGVTASGAESGYKIEGSNLTITAAGAYTITGSSANGSVTVKKGVTGVTLILSSLTLASDHSAALCLNKESEATVYLVGTNTLTDNENPADETSTDAAVADAFEGAALKVKANASLTLTGSGTLNVNGNAKNGVKAGDDAILAFESGVKVNITAANDGINTNSDLTLSGGTFVISAGDDGIHSDAGLTIDGADITISKSNEGIEGATIILESGTGKITASDDGINASADGTALSLTVNGGTWYVNAGGDGLDAGGDSNSDNGTITFNGGTVTVYGAANNGNAALDAGRGITYNGGTVLAIGMSGMAEAPSGGNVLVFGASGMGGGMMGGMRGGMQPNNQTTQTGDTQNNNQMPQMNGMQGGQMPPMGGQPGGRGGMGSMMNGQQPPDMSGMMNGQQPPDMGGMTNGQQPPDMGGMTNGQQPPDMSGMANGQQSSGSIAIKSGSTITITDSSGNVLISATGVKNADSVVFASSAVKEGETYTLTVDGTEAATAVAGQGGTGGFGGMQGGRNQQGTQPQQNSSGTAQSGNTQQNDSAAQSTQPQQTQKPQQSSGTSAAQPKVVVSPQSLTVNDAARSAEAYNIDGNNYFKLRDLAVLLSGTDSGFNVSFDSARNTVVITTGAVYVVVGGELATGKDASASAMRSAQSVEIDGVKTDLTAYNIGGNNFFKLRDLGAVLGFDVGYDAASNTARVMSK